MSSGHELVHHELCFACGRTNLFGLLLELERTSPDSVSGRCFLKQDHQGAERASAHEGVVAAALSDAMSLACGEQARAQSLELHLLGSAPIGTFLEIEASVETRLDGGARASATASVAGQAVATATATYRTV